MARLAAGGLFSARDLDVFHRQQKPERPGWATPVSSNLLLDLIQAP